MSESKEPEGTPVAQGSTEQQGTQTTTTPAAAQPGTATTPSPALEGPGGAASPIQPALAAMQTAAVAMEGALREIQPQLAAMQMVVAAAGGSVAADVQQRDLLPGAGDGVLADVSSGTDSAFFNQLKGVPIDYLVSTPLLSCARANLALASVMTEFIDEIGYVVDKDGKTTTRLLEFDLTRPVKNNLTQDMDTQTIKVKAPLLAVVPLPALLIDSVNVDLTVEIGQQTHQKTNHDTSGTLSVGGRYGFVKAQFTGTYSVKQENTRDTNQTAKYHVVVNAKQQPLPEGMSKLMDVFASTITPLESPTIQ